MKNNTKMNTEKTTELTDTTININIRTGVMHNNKTDEAHTRVDYTGFYISAINYFVRVALEAQSRLEMETDSIVFRNDIVFRENLQFLIQIQEAFVEWLPDYSHALKGESDRSDVISFHRETKDTPGESPKRTDQPKKLSDLLRAIFIHPDAPEWLKGGIWGAMSDNGEYYAYDPEYIEMMIKSAKFDKNEVIK